MCTVTFIPVNGKTFITSNRDEKTLRQKAHPPAIYSVNGQKILFPKDGAAGGSWIAVNEQYGTAVLLNGGFVKHRVNPPYRMSRGILLLEVVQVTNPVYFFQQTDLSGIEPFTIIHFNNQLHQLTWTGDVKHCRQLDPSKPTIWSSVTLYEQPVIAKRERWFADFLINNPIPDQESILDFHMNTGDGDKQNDLVMNRDNKLTTVSITSVEIMEQHCSMKYADRLSNETYVTTIGKESFQSQHIQQ